MRKISLGETVFFSISLTWLGWSPTIATAAVSSDRFWLLPTTQVQIKWPAAKASVSVSTLYSVSSEVAVTSAGALKILCPDLHILEIQPGQAMNCPPVEKNFQFIAKTAAPWEVTPPPPYKGEGESDPMIPPEKRAQFQAEKQRLNTLPVDDALKIFLLANFYASWELYADALRQFETPLASQTDPAALRLVGYLALQNGNPRKAGKYYHAALARSERIEDAEGQALAHHQLALLYESFANRAEAQQHIQRALEWYNRIGRQDDLVTQAQAFSDTLANQ